MTLPFVRVVAAVGCGGYALNGDTDKAAILAIKIAYAGAVGLGVYVSAARLWQQRAQAITS